MKNDRIPMIQIEDTIISIDCLSEKFCCDLDACKGECCIEGDAGAPVELDEVAELEEALPVVWPWLSASAQAVIDRQGVVYTDEDGDLVTSIVNGKDCVFTCYDERGYCYCALEKAYREGKSSFYKPLSCHLYPIRLKKIQMPALHHGHLAYIPTMVVQRHTITNLLQTDGIKMAVMKGGHLNLPVYRFLKEPLIRRFGEEWYTELESAVKELKEQGYLE